MADPANLDPNVSAYIPRNDGDLIRADEWNDIQRSARQDIQKHRHTGDVTNPDDGVRIDTNGLEDDAIKADKIEANAVSRDKIRDQAVNEDKIEDAAVTQAKIKDGSDSIRCNFPVLTDIILIEDLNKFTSEGSDFSPAIAKDLVGNLHVVWQGHLLIGEDEQDEKETIWYAKIDQDGNVLIPSSLKLDTASVSQSIDNALPSIAADLDGNLQIFWQGEDPQTFEDAIYYAKLNVNGEILIEPQAKIRADENTPSRGARFGNIQANAVIDPDGNIQLFWAGTENAESPAIFYAKLDKKGEFIISPAQKFSPNQFNHRPVCVVDSKGKVHVFWENFFRRPSHATPFHAILDLNGNIEVAPAVLRFLLESQTNRVTDAVLAGDGNILLSTGLSFAEFGAKFPKMDSIGNNVNQIFPTYAFVPSAMAMDDDGKFHLVFTHREDIAYAKLDIEKPPLLNASLTELLTTFKQFNFNTGFGPQQGE